METVILSGADGAVRLELPSIFERVPEMEAPNLPVVAAVAGWSNPAMFRPNITVQVDDPSPQLATIEQLSISTAAGQISLGRHVGAVDVFAANGQEPGRRVISLYAGLEATIVSLQYLTIRNGWPITVGLQFDPQRYATQLKIFRFVADHLVVDLPVREVDPDPDALPALVSSDGSTGKGRLESLEVIRGHQRLASAQDRLTDADVEELRGGSARGRRRNPALGAAGLVDADWRLTDAGRAARALLRDHSGEIVADVRLPDGGHRALWAMAEPTTAAVLADPAPGEPNRPGKSIELIPGRTIALALVRWIGVAPVWGPDAADGLSIDRADWDRRLMDPQTPAPDGATDALQTVWREPWELIEVQTRGTVAGDALVRWVRTPSGHYRVPGDAGGATVSLEPISSGELLHLLLILCGVAARTA